MAARSALYRRRAGQRDRGARARGPARGAGHRVDHPGETVASATPPRPSARSAWWARSFDGFDARMAATVPGGFDACGPTRTRSAGATSARGAASPAERRPRHAPALHPPAGRSVVVLRAPRRRRPGACEGSAQRRVRGDGDAERALGRVALPRERARGRRIAFALDLSSAARSPAQVWIDHVARPPAVRARGGEGANRWRGAASGARRGRPKASCRQTARASGRSRARRRRGGRGRRCGGARRSSRARRRRGRGRGGARTGA